MDMARRLNVTVISDEIWSDLTLRGHQHIPLQSVVPMTPGSAPWPCTPPPRPSIWQASSAATTSCITKLSTKRMKKESSLSHYNSMNVLSMHALIGAYSDEGSQWVDQSCGRC